VSGPGGEGAKRIQIDPKRPVSDGAQGSPADPSSASPRASPQRQWAVSSNQATASIVCERPVVPTRIPDADGVFEIVSTNHRFNPSSFFLILALVWTALTVYLRIIYFWNVIIGSAVTASLYGLAWRFRSAGHRAKIS